MKSILITGASSGLGAGLAREFARRGYSLALTARRMNKLEALKSELEEISPEIVLKELDVTQYDAIPMVLEEAQQELGNLDIIVANSGVGFMFPVGSDNFDKIRTTIDTNITGAVATIDAAVRLFQQQGFGHIVGISSVAGVRGLSNSGIYSASKAAVSRYLEALRIEELKSNITVTELAPGYIDTDLNRGLPSRPFVISVEKGTRIMADLIERKVNFSYVPAWPWSLIAKILPLLPARLLSG